MRNQNLSVYTLGFVKATATGWEILFKLSKNSGLR